MNKAISQETMNDTSHSRIPERNESNATASSFRSAAMLGIALSVGASGVVVSQAKASAAVTAPTTSAKTEAFSSSSRVSSPVPEDDSLQVADYHTVGSGESLWQIAQQYHVGLRELKSLNGLAPETSIAVGQVLKVPELALERSGEAQSIAITDTTANSEELAQNTTANSENLLAQQSTDEPIAAAQVSTPAPSIQIEIADAPSQSARTNDDLPVITALATPSVVTNSQASYRVQVGDTLGSIAASLGTTSAELIRANGLSNPNVIYAGATLRVPAARLSQSTQSLASQPVQQAVQQSQSPQQLARNEGLPTESSSSSSNSEQLRSATERLAALRSTANPPSDAGLLTEVRNASPQEAASVGGEQVSAQDVLSSRPGSVAGDANSADPYVADLLEEVEGISDPSSQVAEVDSSKQIASVPEDSTPINNPLASRPVAPVRPTEQVAISNGSSSADSELLAAAPLNPDAYIPAQRSQTGQVVSPDMPLLPSSDQYLPEAPNRFDGYIWPARGTVTSGYGWRWGRMHRGVDVAGPVGTPIVAAAPGVIEQAGWNSGGFGNLVEIRHPDGSMTRYAHNSRLNVSSGQQVAQGQQIAEMGSTGYSTGPHLHFEVHPNGGAAVNPVAYLPSR